MRTQEKWSGKGAAQVTRDSDVANACNLGDKGYKVAEFQPADRIPGTFDELPLDPYGRLGRGVMSGGSHRYRRYDDFRAAFIEGAWELELLPHRPFIQSRVFNKAAGGVARELPPLLIDPAREVSGLLDTFGFDRKRSFHTKVHQIRVVCSSSVHGVAVVEGPHRDGHDWQIVAVFNRDGITGGQSQLLPLGGGAPFFTHTVPVGSAICNEDAHMWHNATDIFPLNAVEGYRDIFIIAANRWEKRKYGNDFEDTSTSDGAADWDSERPEESPEF